MFNPNNPIFGQMFGGFNNFQTGLNQFMQAFGQGNNGNMEQMAQQKVQEMLNSGQISQQQFEQARQMAQQITGMKR